MLYEVLLVAYLIVAILLVGFVLIQQGKGADMGASFGSGGANTIFGSSGSGNFMTRTTAILATLFFAISLVIGGITSGTSDTTDEFENITPVIDDTVPAANDSLIPVEEAEPEVPAVENTIPTEDPDPDQG
ncbi:MAG: preprotein translocase subunit SecG [Glaciecola sp.]